MKNLTKFVFFIIYTIFIFIINDTRVLLALFFINNIIAIMLKINFIKMIYNLKILLPFIIFTVLINIFLDSVYQGILIGIRLIICYNITYIFSNSVSALEVADMLEKICRPLRILGVNTKNIGMMISISICMIPIIKNEMTTILQTLKSKGKAKNISSLVIVLKCVLISILRKTNEIEKTLISKAYLE